MTSNTPIESPPRRIRCAFRFRSWITQAILAVSVLLLPTLASAQETGAIKGRVFKPGTGEYVRYAKVTVSGTDLATESDAQGYYSFPSVPAGSATVVATYTGYKTSSTTVAVSAGQTTALDIDLYLPNQTTTDDKGDIVVLETFTVNAEAEGQAKSIQNQRRSTTIGDHVSADQFGDVADGNVGEFLKHLPGVELEYVQFDARGPRLRGLDPQYVGVTLDGVKLASADAFNVSPGTDNAGTNGSRAFGFDAISLNTIDSVEVYKNLSADQDADAPAGVINLRSKRAFERKGRRVSYTFSGQANSMEFHLRKTPGPGEKESYKTRPSATLEFSDIFLNGRLGINANYSFSSIYNEFQQSAVTTVNRTTSTTDTRPAVPQTLTFTDGPKITDRQAISFRADYKFSPTLAFGVNTTFSNYHAWWDNRQFRFVTSTNNNAAQRATVLGDNPLIEFSTSAPGNALVALVGGGADKFTDGFSVMPSFDWNPTDSLKIEGRFGWSKSDNQYRGLSEGKASSTVVNDLTGVHFTARRSSLESADWVITQTSGPDWGDVANYKNPRIDDEGRSHINEVYSGSLDLTWKKPVFGFPAFVKAGIKSREEYNKFSDRRNWLRYAYVGPGGGATGSFANIPTTDPIDMSELSAYFRSLGTGRPPGYAGRSLAANLYNEHPEYFVGDTAQQTANNFYNAFIGNTRNIYERVDSAYAMGNIQIKKLQIQAGLRFEKTTDEMLQPQQRPRTEVIAAGYGVDGTGRANTIPGLQYQFWSKPFITKETEYDHLFASAAMKYTITDNLTAKFGYHEAINRPPLVVIAGVTTFNDNTRIIQAPNPGLLPEESRNLSAKLEYFLPNSGILSAGVFQIDVDNLRIDYDRPEGTWFDEFPEIDPDVYGSYTVRSTINSPNSQRFRGMELEYRQLLSFLPGFLNTTLVRANYTRNYASVRRGGVAPHQVNLGGTVRYKRFSFSADAVWTSDTDWTNTANSVRFRKERIRTDINASFYINKWATLSISGRDVGNVGMELFEKRPGQPRELVVKDVYGALWTFAIRGTF